MAKILYGVHPITHGHAMRALTLARHFKEHDFLFITGEDAAIILGREFQIVETDNLTTIYRDYKVDITATILQGAKTLLNRKQQIQKTITVMEHFKPDVAIYDYEYFVPLAARQVGLPCLSLDHQHILTACFHQLPSLWFLDYLLQDISMRLFYSKAENYLIISFFQPPVKKGLQALVTPPLLRDTVLEHHPYQGDHILVYQSCSTYEPFAQLLKTVDREFRVYGYGVDKTEGNLTFRTWSEEGFLKDLASCAYVICGGSHTLLSEALYYGKPVLSLPIKAAIEQRLNAIYLERLGYGERHDIHRLDAAAIYRFESKLNSFKKNIEKNEFCGNEDVFRNVEHFIKEKRLPGNRRVQGVP